MRGGALRRLIVVCAFGAVGLGCFGTVAHGDLLPPLPTTTVTVPPTLPPLPTSTTVPLPPVTTATVRLPTTTAPLPTTTVRLPTTTTATVPPRLPSVTSPALPVTSTSASAQGAAPLAGAGSGPPSAGASTARPPGSAAAPARAGKAAVTRISGPAIEALKAGARPAKRPRTHARLRHGKAVPLLHAARVSARTQGLAAFYAGLQKALANDTTDVVGGTTPRFVWPTAAGGGVLSRSGALMLAAALFALALLLAFSLLPRLAAIGFLPRSRTTAQAARESSLVALGAITVCALLAILLLRTAI